MVKIINHSLYIGNINDNNLEQKARKSEDTSVDEENRGSLIQKPVNNEKGNLKFGTFLFLF